MLPPRCPAARMAAALRPFRAIGFARGVGVNQNRLQGTPSASLPKSLRWTRRQAPCVNILSVAPRQPFGRARTIGLGTHNTKQRLMNSRPHSRRHSRGGKSAGRSCAGRWLQSCLRRKDKSTVGTVNESAAWYKKGQQKILPTRTFRAEHPASHPRRFNSGAEAEMPSTPSLFLRGEWDDRRCLLVSSGRRTCPTRRPGWPARRGGAKDWGPDKGASRVRVRMNCIALRAQRPGQ